MAQVNDIVRDALGHLRVIDAGGPVKPIDMRDATRALNLIGRRWAKNGLLETWTDVAEPTDTVPVPDTAEEPLGWNLAIRMRSNYGVEVPEEVGLLAVQGVVDLWRDRIAPDGLARTVGSIVLRALRMLVRGGTPPDTFSLDGALIALNAMMQRWEANGMAMGWSAAAAVDDELPTPPEADEAIAANLAVRLQPEYDAKLSPVVTALADGGLAALRRDRMVEMPLTLDCAFRGGRYNAYTDSYE